MRWQSSTYEEDTYEEEDTYVRVDTYEEEDTYEVLLTYRSLALQTQLTPPGSCNVNSCKKKLRDSKRFPNRFPKKGFRGCP